MRNRTVPTISDKDRAFVERILIQEDQDVLVFNKPSGLPVQTRGNRGQNLDHLLWAFARSNGKRPRLVHRLDTGTSGLILAAKTKPAATYLSKQFEAQSIKKRYLALACPRKEIDDRGVVDRPLQTVDGKPPRAKVDKQGKPARTFWTVLDIRHGFQLIEVRPESGRMHQIRAHMASIGAPLCGDGLYGGQPCSRLMLHAASIEIESVLGQQVTYSAPTGEDWKTAMVAFGFPNQDW